MNLQLTPGHEFVMSIPGTLGKFGASITSNVYKRDGEAGWKLLSPDKDGWYNLKVSDERNVSGTARSLAYSALFKIDVSRVHIRTLDPSDDRVEVAASDCKRHIYNCINTKKTSVPDMSKIDRNTVVNAIEDVNKQFCNYYLESERLKLCIDAIETKIASLNSEAAKYEEVEGKYDKSTYAAMLTQLKDALSNVKSNSFYYNKIKSAISSMKEIFHDEQVDSCLFKLPVPGKGIYTVNKSGEVFKGNEKLTLFEDSLGRYVVNLPDELSRNASQSCITVPMDVLMMYTFRTSDIMSIFGETFVYHIDGELSNNEITNLCTEEDIDNMIEACKNEGNVAELYMWLKCKKNNLMKKHSYLCKLKKNIDKDLDDQKDLLKHFIKCYIQFNEYYWFKQQEANEL